MRAGMWLVRPCDLSATLGTTTNSHPSSFYHEKNSRHRQPRTRLHFLQRFIHHLTLVLPRLPLKPILLLVPFVPLFQLSELENPVGGLLLSFQFVAGFVAGSGMVDDGGEGPEADDEEEGHGE